MIDKEVYHKIAKEVHSGDSPLGIGLKNTHHHHKEAYTNRRTINKSRK